jgi:hypothetical protein
MSMTVIEHVLTLPRFAPRLIRITILNIPDGTQTLRR